MPANPQHIYAALRAIGAQIVSQSQEQLAAEQEALRLLHASAPEPDRLSRAVHAVVSSRDVHLRCALPAHERIDGAFPCTAGHQPCTVVAVDGSQVVPDRHQEVLFGLINIGTVTLRTDSGKVPEVDIDSTLLFGRDLHPGNGPLISEGEIALLRDSRERASLLTRAEITSETGIALTDGPLELWGAKDVSDPGAFEKALLEYLAVLRELEHRGWIVAGYVDKPGADLVVRLIEISIAAAADMERLRSYRPLQGVSDRWLFAQILPPGQRSAVFVMQSASRAKYPGPLSIHFFYLNVGSPGHPAIARIEIPSWVADDPGKLDTLQRTLVDQCAALGARPYPYVLHRAHETARISEAETEQIKLQLLLELRQRGVEPEGPSAKASAKARSEIKGSY